MIRMSTKVGALAQAAPAAEFASSASSSSSSSSEAASDSSSDLEDSLATASSPGDSLLSSTSIDADDERPSGDDELGAAVAAAAALMARANGPVDCPLPPPTPTATATTTTAPTATKTQPHDDDHDGATVEPRRADNNNKKHPNNNPTHDHSPPAPRPRDLADRDLLNSLGGSDKFDQLIKMDTHYKPAANEHSGKPVKMRNLTSGEQTVDTLHLKYKNNNKAHQCNETRCLGSLMNPKPVEQRVRSGAETLEQARDFVNNFYASIKRLDSAAHTNRLREIEDQLATTGTYYLRETELIYGAKLAWRNAPRCIGRIQWSKLQVFDARFISSGQEMFEAICNHIKYATNKGSLRSAITILPQRVKSTDNDWRIWNSQLIGYAGYRERAPDGTIQRITGDPINADFTEICLKLGWKSKRTRFDVLPIVVSANGGPPQLFPLPEELVLRVPIKHPKFAWFEELGLEWYALPAVANMMLDVGGLQFTAAPFSGWYMVTEIGTRDLGDANRYNMLEPIAQRLGLNTRSNSSLWKDQAVVELNLAVLDSFQAAGVTIVDHHTASETFMTHLANEQRLRGGCPADWVWLVPPTAGSTTQVFHQEMVNYHLLPNYEYLEPPWKSFDWLAWEQARQEQARKQRDSLAGGASPLLLGRLAAAGNSPRVANLMAAERKLSADFGSPALSTNSNGELTPRRLRFKEIARAVKFTSKLFGKALSRRIKATILYATETGKSERFANKLAQTFSCAFNVHLMSMSDYDMTCLEHEALLLVVTSTFGNGDPPENGEAFAKHLAAVKLTGDTSPDIDSINAVSTNPFFQMLSEDHKDGLLQQQQQQLDGTIRANSAELAGEAGRSSADGSGAGSASTGAGGAGAGAAADDDDSAKQKRQRQIHEQQTNIRPLSNVRFGVFALGSTAYPHFCAFGRYVDQTLGELGAERICKCACGDELAGQEKAFNEWSSEVFKIACDVFCLTDSIGPIDKRPEVIWTPRDVRFAPVELVDDRQGDANNNNNSSNNNNNSESKPADRLASKKTIVQNLMSITGKKIVPFSVKSRADLHAFIPDENLQTLTMELESELVAGPSQGAAELAQAAGASATSTTAPAGVRPPILFEPGDHVGIYPINKKELVEKIITRMEHDLKLDFTEKQAPLAANSTEDSNTNNSNSNNSNNTIGLRQKPTRQAQSATTIEFDQVYRILVKRENMDLTPNPLTYTGQSQQQQQQQQQQAQQSPQQQACNESWIPYDRLPVTSIREALTRYLDLTNPPNQEFLSILARLTGDLEEKKRLQQMARNFSVYEQWKNRTVPTMLTVLEEFKTIRFVPALITQIPLMKPRFYSISGTSISLTLGVVRFRTATGEQREGLCSNYLNRIPIGPKSHIYGYVRSAPAFHMPQDKSVPMILISAGTGIAPFRSFWQKRFADMYGCGGGGSGARSTDQQLATGGAGAQRMRLATLAQMNESAMNRLSFGRIDMYFGCRNSNYVLYRDELDQMYETGVLSSIHIGFSRPSERDVLDEAAAAAGAPAQTGASFARIENIRQARKRVYVQDKLVENSAEVRKAIMLDEAHVYVCGDVAMADGVYKTLVKILSADQSQDNESVLIDLRNQNRYHEDIFGAKQMS